MRSKSKNNKNATKIYCIHIYIFLLYVSNVVNYYLKIEKSSTLVVLYYYYYYIILLPISRCECIVFVYIYMNILYFLIILLIKTDNIDRYRKYFSRTAYLFQ